MFLGCLEVSTELEIYTTKKSQRSGDGSKRTHTREHQPAEALHAARELADHKESLFSFGAQQPNSRSKSLDR